jgi:hypothetical protein
MADQIEGYEPNFNPLGVHRRVLGHVTDEDHVGRGPRNTVERLAQELVEDPNTSIQGTLDVHQKVAAYLHDLQAVGLVLQRDDDTWVVTDAGYAELSN